MSGMPMWMLVVGGLVVSRAWLQVSGGGGQGCLDRGDLTEPALFLCLLESVGEVCADLLQPWHLSWVNPEEGTSDTHFHARKASRSRGHRSPGLPSAENEVFFELGPFGFGGRPVFPLGAHRAAAGEVALVVAHDVLVEHR